MIPDSMRKMIEDMNRSWIEEITGTFDPDPYHRRAEYKEVPLSAKKLRKIDAAMELLEKYDALIEETPRRTRRKRVWLETKEEYQNRLATLPEHRVDWVRQQFEEGKKPGRMAFWYDEDVMDVVRERAGAQPGQPKTLVVHHQNYIL